MDVGGTLAKIVYFQPNTQSPTQSPAQKGGNNNSSKDDIANRTGESTKSIASTLSRNNSSKSLAQLDDPKHRAALKELYTYLDNNAKSAFSSVNNIVTRDAGLSVYSSILGGMIHFLHFETRNMVSAIKTISSSAVIDNVSSIGCTGGGAHKYAKQFQEHLEITFNKFDELACLIWGMHFALINFSNECYTYRANAVDVTMPLKTTQYDKTKTSNKYPNAKKKKQQEVEQEKQKKKEWASEKKEYTHKVTIDQINYPTKFPYLVVNIGSGVSIVLVKGPGKYERVSGTSLGGGTYWGLCRLLTKCATFEEVLDIAESGNAGRVDMHVRDIYGGDYSESGLVGSMVASSFGKLVMKENPREGLLDQDLALALLVMITNNIGQVAHLNAKLYKCSTIYFVGSFLRHNPISCRRLAFAIDFWSRGSMEALFLVHEGYFGAIGTFLLSAFGDDMEKILIPEKNKDEIEYIPDEEMKESPYR